MSDNGTAYDLWLTSGCDNPPDLRGLTDAMPTLQGPGLVQAVQGWHPHFLGLDLGRTTAAALLERLRNVGARGVFVPSIYRRPTLSEEQARSIAETHITDTLNRNYPAHTLEPVHLLREHAMWWTFGASVVEWVQQARIPGSLFAVVDKLDGHVWQTDELEQFWKVQGSDRVG